MKSCHFLFRASAFHLIMCFFNWTYKFHQMINCEMLILLLGRLSNARCVACYYSTPRSCVQSKHKYTLWFRRFIVNFSGKLTHPKFQILSCIIKVLNQSEYMQFQWTDAKGNTMATPLQDTKRVMWFTKPESVKWLQRRHRAEYGIDSPSMPSSYTSSMALWLYNKRNITQGLLTGGKNILKLGGKSQDSSSTYTVPPPTNKMTGWFSVSSDIVLQSQGGHWPEFDSQNDRREFRETHKNYVKHIFRGNTSLRI
jgi:hypothetical protein